MSEIMVFHEKDVTVFSLFAQIILGSTLQPERFA
jgi:hypothetical protein